MMSDPNPPADLTPAELIAELVTRGRILSVAADQSAAVGHLRTSGELQCKSEAYSEALALVRAVVERLERERDDARAAASRIADAFVRACPAKAPTIKDLIIGQRGDPDA